VFKNRHLALCKAFTRNFTTVSRDIAYKRGTLSNCVFVCFTLGVNNNVLENY